MKFNYEKTNYLKWHKWFAWYPVRLNNKTIVWLETIERKIYFKYESYAGGNLMHYDYRSL